MSNPMPLFGVRTLGVDPRLRGGDGFPGAGGSVSKPPPAWLGEGRWGLATS